MMKSINNNANNNQFKKLIYSIISLILISGLIITSLFISYDIKSNVYEAGLLYLYLIYAIWIGNTLFSVVIVTNVAASILKKKRTFKASFINVFTGYFCIYSFILWYISYMMNMIAVVQHWLSASICGIFGIILLIDSFKKTNK